MADVAERAKKLFDDITAERQERLAAAIHLSIAEAGEAVPVEEALQMLVEFDRTGKPPARRVKP
jgi:hypothetical protein